MTFLLLAAVPAPAEDHGGIRWEGDFQAGLERAALEHGALEHGAGLATRPLDVTDPAAIAEIARDIGPLDVLFNCAGQVHHGT
ncbi:MAG: NAD(P)-dependent oxidoreductase, partial [Planctomycetota bacterium]